MRIRIGTRGSKLALWQAQYIADLLEQGGMQPDLVVIETKGDQIQDQALSKIGSKGLFTAELEAKLRSGDIDIAVHSAKDLPATLTEGLEIIAFTRREIAQDVVVSFNRSARLENFDSSFLVGTSSTRRVALLRHFYPNVRIADIRGNLQTRMRKMEDGKYDALILAYAGVYRMNFHDHIVATLDIREFTPAVGQGCIAVEASQQLDKKKRMMIREWINHEESETCLKAERAFLKALSGGCSIPIFGHAWLEHNNLRLNGGIISLDGQILLRKFGTTIPEHAGELGHTVAEELLENGGEELLKKIKDEIT